MSGLILIALGLAAGLYFFLEGQGGTAGATIPATPSSGASANPKSPYDALFDAAGHEYVIDPDLLRAIARVESSFRPNVTHDDGSGHKSYGLMQIEDSTARSLGVSDLTTLFDPATCIAVACRLLQSLKRELGTSYTLDTWIASYNAGSPTIIKSGIINPDYVAKVKLWYANYQHWGG